jgi:ubiquinone/menaquinone biosynthesis C-methylase UbiE
MRPGDTFLEVCAGWWTFSTVAALWGYIGIGVDIWNVSLSFGRKQRAKLPENVGTYDVVEGDACELPYEDGAFDFVYCNPPFYQLEKYSDDARDISSDQTLDGWLKRSGDMMAEMMRVVAPDGLIVTVMADARIDASLVPLHSLWIAEAQRRGLQLHDIAIQHLLSQQLRFWRHSYDARRTAKAHEYIIVFKKQRS